MPFDFDERYQEVEPVGTAISRREGVVFAAVAHVVIVGVFLLAPQLLPERVRSDPSRLSSPSDAREVMRFVLAPPPKQKAPARPSRRAVSSDADSAAQSPELSARAENPLPTSTGESRDPVDTQPDAERSTPRDPPSESNAPAPDPHTGLPLVASNGASSTVLTKVARGTSVLGGAINQWQRYASGPAFYNPNGAAEPGSQIQFDSKGVDFGPWLRRFVAQVKRNWLVPNAVIGMRGSVIVQFNVHRDGGLTDVTVVAPSPIESFNRAAVNALRASNPTQPLPPEYPDDRAFFTFTFYYNEPVVP